MGVDLFRNSSLSWIAEASRVRRFGDTHNDLRSAASQLSGDYFWSQALCLDRFFDAHSKGETVFDLDAPNFPIAQVLDLFEEFHHLGLQDKVLDAKLRSWTVLASEFDLPNDSEWGIKDRFTSAYGDSIDSTEVDLLHQLQQTSFPW